jgi:hypothetical protein
MLLVIASINRDIYVVSYSIASVNRGIYVVSYSIASGISMLLVIV